MSTYKFKMPPTVRQPSGPLPAGDYDFTVTECNEPYVSSAGNDVLPLKLTIDDTPVWANPWRGKTRDGEERDGIAEFLLCVNRAPKEGQEPDWHRIVGAKGRCHLKVEVAAKGMLAGREVNKLGWFYVSKQLAKEPTYSKAEMDQIRKEAVKDAGGPSENDDPDSIPF